MIFSFLQTHGNLYDFLTNVLKNKSLDNARLLQVRFLDDLINGFHVYKKLREQSAQQTLYLLRNPRRTVYGLFLKTPTDKYNKEISLQAQKLFSLREDISKKLTNKRILNNDSDQSSIVEQKFRESIAKKKKIRTRIKTKI